MACGKFRSRYTVCPKPDACIRIHPATTAVAGRRRAGFRWTGPGSSCVTGPSTAPPATSATRRRRGAVAGTLSAGRDGGPAGRHRWPAATQHRDTPPRRRRTWSRRPRPGAGEAHGSARRSRRLQAALGRSRSTPAAAMPPPAPVPPPVVAQPRRRLQSRPRMRRNPWCRGREQQADTVSSAPSYLCSHPDCLWQGRSPCKSRR